jgi:cell division protein FtsN
LQSNKNDASAVAQNNTDKPQTTQYILQVGSFADITLAKDMKARLAFQGYEAKIKEVNKDSTTTNKVILGPYNSEAAVKDMQQELEGNGIKSTIIKLN